MYKLNVFAGWLVNGHAVWSIQFFFYKIDAGLWGPPFTKSISPLRYTHPFDGTSIPFRAVKSEYGGTAVAKQEFLLLYVIYPAPRSFLNSSGSGICPWNMSYSSRPK